jgi:hypothetical protein
MTYKATGAIGPNLTDVQTSAQHRLGARVDGVDDGTYGEGKFIYLRGVASTAVGDMVVFDESFQTTRAVAASRGPLAAALAAVGANQFGWYQIQGLAVCRTGTVVADTRPYLTATPGQIDDAVVAGQAIDSARFQTADGNPAAGLALVMLAEPSANGNG